MIFSSSFIATLPNLSLALCKYRIQRQISILAFKPISGLSPLTSPVSLISSFGPQSSTFTPLNHSANPYYLILYHLMLHMARIGSHATCTQCCQQNIDLCPLLPARKQDTLKKRSDVLLGLQLFLVSEGFIYNHNHIRKPLKYNCWWAQWKWPISIYETARCEK